jgi:hypothetical protein
LTWQVVDLAAILTVVLLFRRRMDGGLSLKVLMFALMLRQEALILNVIFFTMHLIRKKK